MNNDDAEDTPVMIPVRVDHFNALEEAADRGFVALVDKRNALVKLHQSLAQYPSRDSSNRNDFLVEDIVMINDEIMLDRDDVATILRITEDKIKRLAEALNQRLHNHPRYK